MEYAIENREMNLVQISRLEIVLPPTGGAIPRSRFISIPGFIMQPFSSIDALMTVIFIFVLI